MPPTVYILLDAPYIQEGLNLIKIAHGTTRTDEKGRVWFWNGPTKRWRIQKTKESKGRKKVQPTVAGLALLEADEGDVRTIGGVPYVHEGGQWRQMDEGESVDIGGVSHTYADGRLMSDEERGRRDKRAKPGARKPAGDLGLPPTELTDRDIDLLKPVRRMMLVPSEDSPVTLEPKSGKRKKLDSLLDSMKANQQSDIRNAAQIYAVAQTAINELAQQTGEDLPAVQPSEDATRQNEISKKLKALEGKSGKARLNGLLSLLRENQELDTRNAAAVYAIAQGTVNQLGNMAEGDRASIAPAGRELALDSSPATLKPKSQ